MHLPALSPSSASLMLHRALFKRGQRPLELHLVPARERRRRVRHGCLCRPFIVAAHRPRKSVTQLAHKLHTHESSFDIQVAGILGKLTRKRRSSMFSSSVGASNAAALSDAARSCSKMRRKSERRAGTCVVEFYSQTRKHLAKCTTMHKSCAFFSTNQFSRAREARAKIRKRSPS